MTKPLWTSEEIAKAVNGEASDTFNCNGVAFDSREIEDGDLFLALKGEQSDGHLYINTASENGACGAITSQDVSMPHILVEDTTVALDELGRASRARCDAVIIGVTGSVGKTGTKEALFAALDRSSRGKAHRSVKSYNNHVGVPLSLSRMPMDSQYGVFEMGMNHKGELRDLSAIVRPHIAIVTTIAPAHVEFFKDETEIAAAKAEIFEGLEKGGTAILPIDSPHFDQLKQKALSNGANIVSFGLSRDADVCAVDVVKSENGGSLITAKIRDKSLIYTVSQPGEHWVANSLAVMAAVDCAGGDLASAGLALADMEGLAGRGARHITQFEEKNILLIDESYNANPSSMAVTIAELGTVEASRRVVILGDMGELGHKSRGYHIDIAEHLISVEIGYAILIGEEMQILAKELRSGVEPRIKCDHCMDLQSALNLCHQHIKDDDAILVKASNYMGLSAVVKKLLGGKS